MPTCKHCDRSGFFLTVTQFGLCQSCAPLIRMEIAQVAPLLRDCMRLIAESKNLDVKLSRLDLLLERAQRLLAYENRDIPTFDPPPSSLLKTYRSKRDVIIKEGLETEVRNARAKESLAATVKAKVGHLSKALLKVREYKGKASTPRMVENLEGDLQQRISIVQLNGCLDQAKKAEFKGQQKKALDQYYEALYFLRHDEVDDGLQKEQIGLVEAKIKELGGTIR